MTTLWKDIKDTLTPYDMAVQYGANEPRPIDPLRDLRPVALDAPSELVCAVLQSNLTAALKEIKTAADYILLLTDDPNSLTLRTVEGSSVRIGANVRQGTEGHAIAVPYKALAQAVPTWSNDRVDITYAPKWRMLWEVKKVGFSEQTATIIREDDALRFRCASNVAHIVALTVPAPRDTENAVEWQAEVKHTDLALCAVSAWACLDKHAEFRNRFTRSVRIEATADALHLHASDAYTLIRMTVPAVTSAPRSLYAKALDWLQLDRTVKTTKHAGTWTLADTGDGLTLRGEMGQKVSVDYSDGDLWPNAMDDALTKPYKGSITVSLLPYATRPKLNKKGKEIGREALDKGIEGRLSQVELYARDTAFTSRWTLSPEGVTVFGRSQERGEITVDIPTLDAVGVEGGVLHMNIQYALRVVKLLKAAGATEMTVEFNEANEPYRFTGNDPYNTVVLVSPMTR